MKGNLLDPRDIKFQMYELLDTVSLLKRPRYQALSKEFFDVTVALSQSIAEEHFANHYLQDDINQPVVDGERRQVSEVDMSEIKVAWKASAEGGFMSAGWDSSEGGKQLPGIVCTVAEAYMRAANTATTRYQFLSGIVCNAIRRFGSDKQKSLYMTPLVEGRFSGVGCWAEFDNSQSQLDVKMTAVYQQDGSYKLNGDKIPISCGNHNLTENIIYLVPAKTEGLKGDMCGISLFIVPKTLIGDDGSLGERNDVVLDKLASMVGNLNLTSALISMGGCRGAVGYLLGELNLGQMYISQMKSEAQFGVGIDASALACRGYLHSLHYARSQPRTSIVGSKVVSSEQSMLIDHANVRRMLLVQKSYAEGALALSLYACSLAEDSLTADTECEKQRALALINILSPVVSSWPSKYGCISNDLAIQVFAGRGYRGDALVEQLYRDQQCNFFHGSSESIQSLELLGRKVSKHHQYAYEILCQEVRITIELANNQAMLTELVVPLKEALVRLDCVTEYLITLVTKDPDRGLANAVVYLDFFGCVVMSWVWLKQALVSAKYLENLSDNLKSSERCFYQGKLQAARYYIEWELPKTVQMAELLVSKNDIFVDMRDDWFG